MIQTRGDEKTKNEIQTNFDLLLSRARIVFLPSRPVFVFHIDNDTFAPCLSSHFEIEFRLAFGERAKELLFFAIDRRQTAENVFRLLENAKNSYPGNQRTSVLATNNVFDIRRRIIIVSRKGEGECAAKSIDGAHCFCYRRGDVHNFAAKFITLRSCAYFSDGCRPNGTERLVLLLGSSR